MIHGFKNRMKSIYLNLTLFDLIHTNKKALNLIPILINRPSIRWQVTTQKEVKMRNMVSIIPISVTLVTKIIILHNSIKKQEAHSTVQIHLPRGKIIADYKAIKQQLQMKLILLIMQIKILTITHASKFSSFYHL